MTTKISGDNISAIANQGVTWNAVTVADGSTQLNASAGNGYFLDTNAGVIDVKLPSSPTRGDTIVLADYGNNFATNRVVVDTGGKLIDSVVGGEPGTGGFTIETNGAVVELVFADDTAGWIIKQNNAPSDLGAEDYAEYISATGGTVATSGDFKIHTFTGDGCFVVSCAGNSDGSNTVDYLVVAGGGGGGVNGGYPSFPRGSGGGGAGGFRYSAATYCSPSCAPGHPLRSPTGITLSATTYPITVGGGGSGRTAPTNPDQGAAGSNSVFSPITSTGGGGGGGHCQGTSAPLLGGGSGAGGRNGIATAGSGNSPPVSPPQGNPGGGALGGDVTNNFTGGGGGGAGGAGGAGNTSAGAVGGVGAGIPNAFGTTGEPSGGFYYYAGGGASGNGYSGPVGAGGLGGGGPGGAHPSSSAGPAAANRGGGGGGTGGQAAGSSSSGGKGLVVLRYKYQ